MTSPDNLRCNEIDELRTLTMTTVFTRRFAGLTIAALIAAGLVVGPSVPMGPAGDVETRHCVATAGESGGLSASELCEAMDGRLSLARYAQLVGPVTDALQRSEATTPDRMAMWLAQIGHESGGLRYMEEQADGSQYEGRTDLGNTEPGDGQRFKGRGPIQITGRNNYTQFSLWAHDQGLTPTATWFVDRPEELASDRYGFYAAAWYWTVARPQINSLTDAGDLTGVTKAINGGLHGIEDRRKFWTKNKALSLSTDGVD